MQYPGTWTIAAAALALALAACGDSQPQAPDTAVLGGQAQGRAPAPPTDARGRPFPALRLPAGARAEMIRIGDEAALAAWVQDGVPMTASHAPGTGWSAPIALEELHGDASDVQLAADAHGNALAVWRHTVGSIRSLRSARYEAAAGWSVPDVMPGALPLAAGTGSAPELEMDAQGRAIARWRSGFDAAEQQVARYEPGQGWSRAASTPLAGAPPQAVVR